MKKTIMLAVLAVGLGVDGLAAQRNDYPPISFAVPGAGRSTNSLDQFVIVVVERGVINHDQKPVATDDIVGYINTVLKDQGAPYLGVHIREGVTFGDVVRALDRLRLTTATSIAVSMAPLPAGRDP